MNKRGISPLSLTFLLVLFAIAVGAVVMNSWEYSLEATNETSSDQISCDPVTTLKLKFINNQITEEEYMSMKSVIENS